MISNGNGHSITKAQRRGEAVEQLLNGRSEAIKTNVLNYIVKYNINPEHEFFVIFVALGTLETLIETSPQEWQEIFKGFEGELGKWANSNLETLNLISQKASITEQLARNSESLANTLKQFLEVCGEQTIQLQKCNSLLTSYLSQLQTSSTELKSLGEKNNNQISQLESQVNNLSSTLENQSKSNPPNKKIWTWKDNVLIGLVISVLVTTVSFGVVQNQVNQKMGQRVQWLLEKANRRDCLAGIKKPNSPECKSL